MATQEQYTAADVAVKKHADAMIAALPGFEQGMVRQNLTDRMLNDFAKVAVDAVVK